MAQWVENPVLSLLWLGFDPWPWNFCLLQAQPKDNSNKFLKNRSRVITQNHRGNVSRGAMHFIPDPTSVSRRLFPRLLGKLTLRGVSWVLFKFPTAEESLFAYGNAPSLSVTLDLGPMPLLQGRTTVKSHSSPRACRKIGLWCKHIISLSTHRCCFWEFSLKNPPRSHLSLRLCFSGEPNLQQ